MSFEDRTREWIHKPKFSEVPESDRNQYYRGMLNDFRKEHKQFDEFLIRLNELLKAEKNDGYSNIVKFIDGEAEWTWIASENSIFDGLIKLYNLCLSPLQAYEYIKDCLALYKGLLAEDYINCGSDFPTVEPNHYDGKKDTFINIHVWLKEEKDNSIFKVYEFKNDTAHTYKVIDNAMFVIKVTTQLRNVIVPKKSNDLLEYGFMKFCPNSEKVQDMLMLFEYHQDNKGLLKKIFLQMMKREEKTRCIKEISHREEDDKEYYDYEENRKIWIL